jgi:hypothetical protein
MKKNDPNYHRDYYLSHKEGRIVQVILRANTLRDVVREAKSKSCIDCGMKYAYWVMQFDHVRGEKLFNIGYDFHRHGLQKVLDEIAKCDVVCANCHADRTHKRLALSSTD